MKDNTIKVDHATFGEITYNENIWTGKRIITINGQELVKEKKNVYLCTNENGALKVTVKGSVFSGISLIINGESIEISAKPQWYELACSISIFVLILIWGNSSKLCSIIPVVGGAIGGGISGAMAIVTLASMKSAKSVKAKLVVWLGMLVGTFAICAALAFVILGLL